MTDHNSPPQGQPDEQRAIEQEIRQGRTFSLAAAIGQEAGDFLKGVSPVPKLLQVKTELLGFVGQHLHDPEGALMATLRDLIQTDDVVCSRHFDAPLSALAELLRPMLTQEAHLRDFVRRVDMRWGQMYCTRPHFEVPGLPPHPDDEYTHASVRVQLTQLLTAINQHRAGDR
ncbi:MAG TPA: hypothetical protein V6D02_05705 [Candidatus Obscuribacterales bacterium]